MKTRFVSTMYTDLDNKKTLPISFCNSLYTALGQLMEHHKRTNFLVTKYALEVSGQMVKHVSSNSDQTPQVRPSSVRTREMFLLFLIEYFVAFNFYQTRPNTIKEHQTRWPNGKMVGHQTIFDVV